VDGPELGGGGGCERQRGNVSSIATGSPQPAKEEIAANTTGFYETFRKTTLLKGQEEKCKRERELAETPKVRGKGEMTVLEFTSSESRACEGQGNEKEEEEGQSSLERESKRQAKDLFRSPLALESLDLPWA